MVATLLSHPLLWQYGLALAIASASVVVAGRLGGGREARTALPAYFAWCTEHRTFVNVIGIVRFARQRPWMWIVPAFAVAPSVAALIVASGSSGRAGLHDLLARLRPWQDGLATSAIVTYAVLLTVHVAVSAWYLQVTTAELAAGTVTDRPGIMVGRSAPRVMGRLVLGVVTDEGGSLEELGWRGYVVPLLLASTGNRLTTTLLIAVLWWAWHLPREVPALLHRPKWKQFVRNQAMFVGTCVALSVICTEVVVRTGSVWPAIIVHGGTNVWSKAVSAGPFARYRTDVRTWITGAAAAIVALSWVFT